MGKFVIRGRYDLKSGEVTIHKHYLGQHWIYYRGVNEESKGIWGTWQIKQFMRGGFHIWPAGMADPRCPRLAEEVELCEEQEMAEALVVTREH